MTAQKGGPAQAIQACRICGNRDLVRILDLGEQALTGVFPASAETPVSTGPLRLVRCAGDAAACGLVQLEHSYDLGEMYGENYGYRSGLNSGMVRHLHAKVQRILGQVTLAPGDMVIDVGSNDGTTLAAYPDSLLRVGIDPTAAKFARYYPDGCVAVADFFDAGALARHGIRRKAKVLTSFSMFYDLEAPLKFMRDVYECLADDGVWVFEQSYLPAMLETNSYDTVCHEHLEYYALRQVKWMADRVGFVLVDVEFNDVNGGSFSVVATRAPGAVESPRVPAILARESALGLDGSQPYADFADRVAASRAEILAFLAAAKAEGRTVAALGASTKGNVLLQYCGLGPGDIAAIGEVNPEKFGRLTPGTHIPIVPQDQLLASRPDYLLVLPWHFRRFFQDSAVFAGHELVFPLPRLERVRSARVDR